MLAFAGLHFIERNVPKKLHRTNSKESHNPLNLNLLFPLPLVSGLNGRLKHSRTLNKVGLGKSKPIKVKYPPELVTLAAYVSEDGLVGHHW